MGEKEFTYVHDTTLHCVSQPSGVASFLFQLKDTPITGIGGTHSPLTAMIKNGSIYYNTKHDFITSGEEKEGTIFKMVIYNEPTNNCLRIDFHKLKSSGDDQTKEPWKTMIDLDNIVDPTEDVGDLIKKYQGYLKKSSNVPDLVFLGELPKEAPKDVETCIGICVFRNIKPNVD
ncbi:unnamed protein product [Ambrosiozyma monospora]|uniref:Unnamed protein product n=1 Tax=Ambrosiozyma monospora TaxID=43982 RepID=A0ACB5UCB5_AMBMO|nr:unnamed protein product [Ambrosiozyma monospora]